MPSNLEKEFGEFSWQDIRKAEWTRASSDSSIKEDFGKIPIILLGTILTLFVLSAVFVRKRIA